MKKTILNPLDIPRANKKKKPKVHSKNPYRIKKIRLLGEQAIKQKHLDGFMMLKLLHIENPKDILKANISYKRIISVEVEHLKYFENLIDLNCSENRIKMEWLINLPVLQKLHISHNGIGGVPLEIKNFRNLKTLNVSFNCIEFHYIPHLSMIPNLKDLNIGYNELKELPDDLSSFECLTKLNLAGNKFTSSYKASHFWSSLATIQKLNHLDVSRNQIRGIHTEKLINGNFGCLQVLDFSYNSVENQHNLICTRNFKSLKKVIATGNLFATTGNYKGLEMEIQARTGGELIIEQVNVPYLKNEGKERIPITFNRIVKIESDNFEKSKNILFGVDIVKQPFEESEQVIRDLTQQSSEQQPQDEIKYESSSESQEQKPMFLTEQPNLPRQKKEKPSVQTPLSNVQQNTEQLQSHSRNQDYPDDNSQSVRSNISSASMRMDEFRKIAAEMIGSSKEYSQAFDINTAYKALKGALSRSKNG